MSEHNLISVDLAKNVFQLCAMTDRMNIVFNRQLKRKDLARFMATQKPVEVVMEACYSSHYWGRCFAAMGHQVRLLPAQHVEIAMVPLGRMGGPGTFESAGDRITANAPASLVDPAQALFFNAGSFGLRPQQCSVAITMGFANGMAAGSQGHGFLVVHGHAGERMRGQASHFTKVENGDVKSKA